MRAVAAGKMLDRIVDRPRPCLSAFNRDVSVVPPAICEADGGDHAAQMKKLTRDGGSKRTIDMMRSQVVDELKCG